MNFFSSPLWLDGGWPGRLSFFRLRIDCRAVRRTNAPNRGQVVSGVDRIVGRSHPGGRDATQRAPPEVVRDLFDQLHQRLNLAFQFLAQPLLDADVDLHVVLAVRPRGAGDLDGPRHDRHVEVFQFPQFELGQHAPPRGERQGERARRGTGQFRNHGV